MNVDYIWLRTVSMGRRENPVGGVSIGDGRTNSGAQWIYLRSLLLHAVKRRDKPGRPVVASQS